MNTPSPCHDPIVAEIHHIRIRLAEQYHNDLIAYSEAAEAHCRALGLNLVESPKTQPPLVVPSEQAPIAK